MAQFGIINNVIKNKGYKTYLEIGVSVPDLNFDLIECEYKEGCDPYSLQESDYDFGEFSDRLEEFREKITYCMTSDEMFASMPEEKKFDVIFIDGLHTEEGTKRDIVNSLKHISENGTIIVHDVLPRMEMYAQEERVVDEWYGCAYKAILDFGKIGGIFCCVKQGEENGFAFIPYQVLTEEQENVYMQKSTYEWKDYEENKPSIMHIVDMEYYGANVMIYHNSDYLNKPENRHFDENGSLVFGGTEYWVVGIAENLARWGFNVTVFSDVMLGTNRRGVEYLPRTSDKIHRHFDAALVTTNIEITKSLDCSNIILVPTCEMFNTNFGEFAPADKVGMLSEWQKKEYMHWYDIPEDMIFKHFLPCQHDMYNDYLAYEKENSMVWSSNPVRGLRFFIERVMPKIKNVFPDFKLYICGYDERYYEKEWPKHVTGVQPIVNAGKRELSELQKKSKIWVYPNIGRSETSGYFYETYCITAVENALAGNAIVCFGGKDGISTTLEGYEGFLDGNIFNEREDNFMFHYEMLAYALADKAIEILSNDYYRMQLSNSARKICEKYTWDNETAIICSKITNQ